MLKYKLSEEAKEDLVRVYQWGVLQYGLQKADNYFASFYGAFEQIALAPLSYPSVDYIRQGYRRKVRGVDNIYYRINDNIVEIMAVLGKQDAENLLQERNQ